MRASENRKQETCRTPQQLQLPETPSPSCECTALASGKRQARKGVVIVPSPPRRPRVLHFEGRDDRTTRARSALTHQHPFDRRPSADCNVHRAALENTGAASEEKHQPIALQHLWGDRCEPSSSYSGQAQGNHHYQLPGKGDKRAAVIVRGAFPASGDQDDGTQNLSRCERHDQEGVRTAPPRRC